MAIRNQTLDGPGTPPDDDQQNPYPTTTAENPVVTQQSADLNPIAEQQAGGATGNYGTNVNLQRPYLENWINQAFQRKRGSNATADELSYWLQKLTTPEEYSDGKWRVGANDYRLQQILTGGSPGNPQGLAGDDGVISDPSKWGLVSGTQGADSGSFDDWFQQNQPDLQAPPQYQALARPDYLQGEYKIPEWTDQFKAPTISDLYADPGYQARLEAAQKASERSAAAKGSILSGGFQTALGKSQQQLASDEYGNAFNRALGTYQQRLSDFNTNTQNALTARGINEAAFQNDAAQNQSQYDERYRAWRDYVGDQFNLSQQGLAALTAGRPA